MRGPLLASLLASLLAVPLLAGCTAEDGGDGSESSTTTAQGTDACPTVTDATVVPGWTKRGGQWGVVAAMEDRVDAVCGEADQPLSILLSSGTFSSVNASVAFNLLQDDVGGGSGAGLVINWKGDGDYVIVRYSPREQGWHLFTMTGGERVKRDEASVTPPTTNPEYHTWVNLTVVHKDGHVEAWDNGTKVIDYVLPEGASRSGQVGYFLRDEGMAALFDDFRATAA